ncbi:MAG TPA: dihydrofolate reductase family protein [Candidatus Tumulicola sp.]|jgi:dihydrofolate reductase
MAKVRVHCFSISVDGFSAGPDQDIDNPGGVGGLSVFGWQFATRAQREMHGGDGGETGLDNDLVHEGFDGIGAWIIGRNMFGPVRGPWPDESWKGWWGDDPVYHTPVFVLSQYPRDPVEMQGGTTFHFVNDGIEAALERAKAAANGKDVRIGGGVATLRQYLRAGLVDELHLVQVPVLLGSGERLFDGLDLVGCGYRVRERISSPNATHVFITKAT